MTKPLKLTTDRERALLDTQIQALSTPELEETLHQLRALADEIAFGSRPQEDAAQARKAA